MISEHDKPTEAESAEAENEPLVDSEELDQEAPLSTGEQMILEARAEAEKYKDQLLRNLAELENVRKRAEREVRDAKEFAISSFARDMLAVGDNLHRALDAISQDERDNAEPVLKSLLEGVEMTEREMLNKLEKHGVKKLDPEGERFDPNFHQAMFEVPNAELPNNTVVQVVQTGYVIGPRVLRPAMVGVSKGGPKAGAAPKPAEPSNDYKDTSTDDAGGTVDRSV